MTDLKELSEIVGVEVEQHPYDVGYWRRIAGLTRPRRVAERQGWDAADEELKDEAECED